jgi:hypothetical protein
MPDTGVRGEDAAEAPAENRPEGWTDEVAESAFLAEARDRGENIPSPNVSQESDVDAGPLPPLEELVNRIDPAIRETLDELFRAKFTAVRRVPPSALKP